MPVGKTTASEKHHCSCGCKHSQCVLCLCITFDFLLILHFLICLIVNQLLAFFFSQKYLQLHHKCGNVLNLLGLIPHPAFIWASCLLGALVATGTNSITLNNIVAVITSLASGLFSPRAGSQPAEARRPTDEPAGRGAPGGSQQVASLLAGGTAAVGLHSTQEPLSDRARQRWQARLHAHLRWVAALEMDLDEASRCDPEPLCVYGWQVNCGHGVRN